MNILIIPSFFMSNVNKGVGSFVFDQAVALKKSGNNVYIIFCDTFSIREIGKYVRFKEKEYCDNDGIHIIRKKKFCLFKHSNGFFGCKETYSKEIYKLYIKYLKSCNIDIIHAHGCVWAANAAMNIYKKTNIKYVVTEHSTVKELETRNIKYINAIKESLSLSKANIAVSGNLKKELLKFSNNIDVIGNVVNCDVFNITNEEKEYDFITVFAMNTYKQILNKGIYDLISAFGTLKKEYPTLKMAIVGSGNEKKRIEKYVNSICLKESITFLGRLNHEEVSKYMNKSKVFVLPSKYETFGIVFIEAMACGVPVVATDCGGTRDFVNSANGIMVENVKDELIDSMKYMINNIDKYDRLSIRKQIVDNYSEKEISSKLMDVYKKV